MRTNLPVTQNEYQFPGAEQLMGQPHKLVRHPDMPVKAFADRWHMVTTEVRSLAGRSAAATSMGDQALRLKAAVKVFAE